jgi:hypothetical protein
MNICRVFRLKMDEIFARAKSILVIWADDDDPENLPVFQDTLQTKAKQAHIAFENIQMLLECKFNIKVFQKKEKYLFYYKSSSCNIII